MSKKSWLGYVVSVTTAKSETLLKVDKFISGKELSRLISDRCGKRWLRLPHRFCKSDLRKQEFLDFKSEAACRMETITEFVLEHFEALSGLNGYVCAEALESFPHPYLQVDFCLKQEALSAVLREIGTVVRVERSVEVVWSFCITPCGAVRYPDSVERKKPVFGASRNELLLWFNS
ncbi:MAG TPA: hypothetical protein PLC15_09560 [Candidatus Obscuribacter sp.]|nr:hypothetical protein [Candidatus Obscuribacter sp.]HMW89955.1 hypothetical protein [Candidatus Obscuribacter sp.]HMX46629.1 hypothetical protein [Candidatus Obscuribacter sp.]HMY54866.1 hypothetical protein [Candidatus Obscuribacter sp.]HNB15618.1 hypothetical protein [Candidatus Obscuribacter sp.]